LQTRKKKWEGKFEVSATGMPGITIVRLMMLNKNATKSLKHTVLFRWMCLLFASWHIKFFETKHLYKAKQLPKSIIWLHIQTITQVVFPGTKFDRRINFTHVDIPFVMILVQFTEAIVLMDLFYCITTLLGWLALWLAFGDVSPTFLYHQLLILLFLTKSDGSLANIVSSKWSSQKLWNEK
jgi:hypothetical protein